MERRLNRRKFLHTGHSNNFSDSYLITARKQAKLERVIGCTVLSRTSISVDENKGIVAYPAGSTVVLHNPKSNSQAHLIGSTKNNVTCLCFSRCGRYLATGESGHEPSLRVWELYDHNGQFASMQIVDIKNHEFGIVCVHFTPDGKNIISIGNQHDQAIVVWDWKNQKKIASNRLSSKVHSADITEQGASYVTVGVRHVKFWHVAEIDASKSIPLQGRSAILAEQRNNTFLDVCCAPNNQTFAITETSLLVEFHDKKLTSTYDLHGELPHSIALGSGELFIGFTNGTIRSFDASTMAHKLTYCKPHYLTCDVANGINADAFKPASHPKNCRYPDVRALCYNRKAGILTAVYADRSIYNWYKSYDRIHKLSSQLFHVGPIFALEMYPSFPWLLPGTFISGGADETVRIWNIDQRTKVFEKDSLLFHPETNVYSDELKKVIYVSNSESSLTEPNNAIMTALITDVTNGIKSLKVSPDGHHLAIGGRDGNLSVIDLTNPETPLIAFYEAHESDILCLEFSDSEKGRYLLATGSRDRLVHIFDPGNNYEPIATVDDHTSAINSIVFVKEVSELYLITCAADKTIVIRKLVDSQPSLVCFDRVNHISSQFGLNSMIKCSDGIMVACQDRQIRTYTVQGRPGKLMKHVKGATGDDGQLRKIRLDPSETFAATASTDRNVYIIDIGTGECAAILSGHSDNITDIGFSSDCRRLIVVSYNGCIFVWRLSSALTNRMIAKFRRVAPGSLVDKSKERSETPDSLIGSDATCEEIPGAISLSKVKDSESEFGSLNSVRIAEEDGDSCIGQKPDTVILKQADISSPGNCEFELRRVATEVVRRKSTLQCQKNWEDVQTASDFYNDKTLEFDSTRISSSLIAPENTSFYTTSRSMSNLRPAMCEQTLVSGGSPRRSRKKWEEISGYASPFIFRQQKTLAAHSIDTEIGRNMSSPNHCSKKIINDSSSVYRTPESTPQLRNFANPMINSSISMSAISQYQQQQCARSSTFSPVTPDMRDFQCSTPLKTDVSRPFQKLINENAFDRLSVRRCSLTKKFMSTNEQTEPRTVWIPPAISSRRSSSNVHYSSPSGGAASAIIRRQEDYTISDLHLRSRSQSPSQLMLNICTDTSQLKQRQRQDSDMSLYSVVTMASSRITPSSSRVNLRTVGAPTKQSSQAIEKLNQLRGILRKSQENLVNAVGDRNIPSSSSSSMLRSKSIGNLRFCAASPVSLNRAYMVSTSSASSALSSAAKGLLDTSSLSKKSKFIARSVGSLHINADLDSAENICREESRFPSKLAQTIENLKKASNPDLTQFDVSNNVKLSRETGIEDGEIEAFYFLRNQRGKGAVQKKVERFQPRISRETTSGESDSNGSEVNNNSSFVRNDASSVNQRYFSMNGSNRQSLLQSTRRIFEQQRRNSCNSSTNVSRRVPNYLVQKFAEDMVGPDVGAEESPRQLSSPSDLSAFNELDGRNQQSKQMARHVAECLEQFNTGLDKVLQARQLLEGSQHLPVDDRKLMMRVLNQAIRTGRKRLSVQDEHETDGRSNDNPNNFSNLCQGIASLPTSNEMSMSSQIDPATFLQQHGHQLLMFLQQNMAKQN